jgi:glutamate decarboxylase
MIARLFNAPSHEDANIIGTSTIGSSEAIMVSIYIRRDWRDQELTPYSWECSL